MAIAKLILNNATQMDLTADTVTTSDHIMEGYVGHLRNGTSVTGTGKIAASEQAALDALVRYSNEVTGESDTTISDAVETLVDGYGQGGSSDFEVIDRFSFSEDTLEYTFTHSGPGLYVFCEEPVLTLQKAVEDARRNYSLFNACFSIYGTTSARAGTSLVYKSNNHSVDYWGGAGVSISGNNATIKITSNASANIKFEAGINYMILKMST